MISEEFSRNKDRYSPPTNVHNSNSSVLDKDTKDKDSPAAKNDNSKQPFDSSPRLFGDSNKAASTIRESLKKINQ